ncbi:hypothetical protein HPB48_019549 [Haemaphysalis longicornis]|uniref:Uncharacterized protein n=1 Tax=Haemaphysalis longicornis TaxID=44386 RepID=A0A9J6FP80_HAELO|nr:hypothetical protein HPB48_019549 [Haemaphysalis longicornis]
MFVEEWRRQARFFRDCLRTHCGELSLDRVYRDWCRTIDQTTEFLWQAVRPSLPRKEKASPTQGRLQTLGEVQLPEHHLRELELGPKFCFEPRLLPVDKVALARGISRHAPEAERSSYHGFRAFFARLNLLRGKRTIINVAEFCHEVFIGRFRAVIFQQVVPVNTNKLLSEYIQGACVNQSKR